MSQASSMISRCRKITLLWLAVAFLAACTPNDTDINIHPSSNIFHPCDTGTTWFTGYFGQYYIQGKGCNGGGLDGDVQYLGPPQGPIILRWKAVYKDPEKEDRPYPEQIIKRRFFYAERHEPVRVPPRRKNHWMYELYISFGPRAVLTREAIVGDDLKVVPYKTEYGNVNYQVGDIDAVYYFIRSRPRNRTPDWTLVEEGKFRFKEIKGIELTKEQYMTIACELKKECDERLDEDAPGLTDEQLAYLRAARTSAQSQPRKAP